MFNKIYALSLILITTLLAASCASVSEKPKVIPDSLKTDDLVARNYEQRTWRPPSQVSFDPIGMAQQVEIPINHAHTKIIGPSY
ncbi:MAG: hypothetical protein PVG22_14845, partial [Chromatiales bacterium]